MKFEPFVMERCLCRWENTVRLNISESGVHPLTLAELAGDVDLGDTLLGYPQSNGTIPLRERIAALYPGSNADQIIVTTGTAEANFLSALTTLSPGDEVVAMIPNYMQLIGACRSFGARVVPFPLVEENGWRPDLDALEAAVSERTRMIAICNPNNPSGAILTEAEMDRIVGDRGVVGRLAARRRGLSGRRTERRGVPELLGPHREDPAERGALEGLRAARPPGRVDGHHRGEGGRALGPPGLQQPRGERAGRPAGADRPRQAPGHPGADPGHHPPAVADGVRLGGVP